MKVMIEPTISTKEEIEQLTDSELSLDTEETVDYLIKLARYVLKLEQRIESLDDYIDQLHNLGEYE